ncbi:MULTISPECIES: chorismate mutase [unclassified Bacillus (in: firmicutes)]|uniref:chorismate mutase n=1 Tax=unclassified Bacillus (in: firmicutes) TaxID=185979 RepID=UPI0008F307C0|nr:MULTISPECIES: chorismate mutase [unclassified Bacillus (in: firmicutes)]SFA98548.1 chorismate mutase [Bacillus sp. UNCCL13]SFQ81119.1 chorismate mutase [Bacillus sp. cl95]
MIRGVRGAITMKENLEEDILAGTERLLRTMIERNGIVADNVASVLISATDDLNATFPAKALRRLEDWTYVPVMCMKELEIPNGIRKCVRIMIHLNTDVPQSEVKHVYLDGAVILRPDLLNK